MRSKIIFTFLLAFISLLNISYSNKYDYFVSDEKVRYYQKSSLDGYEYIVFTSVGDPATRIKIYKNKIILFEGILEKSSPVDDGGYQHFNNREPKFILKDINNDGIFDMIIRYNVCDNAFYNTKIKVPVVVSDKINSFKKVVISQDTSNVVYIEYFRGNDFGSSKYYTDLRVFSINEKVLILHEKYELINYKNEMTTEDAARSSENEIDYNKTYNYGDAFLCKYNYKFIEQTLKVYQYNNAKKDFDLVETIEDNKEIELRILQAVMKEAI